MLPPFRFAWECLKAAFARVRAAPGRSLFVGFAYFALALGFQWIASIRLWHNKLSVILAVLLCQGLLGILIIGLARFFLTLADGGSPRWLELLDGFRAPWKIMAGTLFGWLIGTFVLFLLVFLGRDPIAFLLVLGVLPLVLFWPFLVADGAASQAVDTFLVSFRFGISRYPQALAVAVVIVGLVGIGAVLVVGTLVSIPLCYTMAAVAYRSFATEWR